ncbi:YeeE/YedE thiosulfate transporter family protein, partial [Salmonella enterica]|nr:YeeE/YedE thiosulfate transporter family protein [Salmonella enterica]
SVPVLILAGLFVGFGTRLGGGCTSGHGICGMSRFSRRSIVAVIIFMLVAFVTVALANQYGLRG